mgnify:CR=1 FL=1
MVVQVVLVMVVLEVAELVVYVQVLDLLLEVAQVLKIPILQSQQQIIV